jgi:hypothetical protein
LNRTASFGAVGDNTLIESGFPEYTVKLNGIGEFYFIDESNSFILKIVGGIAKEKQIDKLFEFVNIHTPIEFVPEIEVTPVLLEQTVHVPVTTQVPTKGEKGDRGDRGFIGERGEKGERGDLGPSGPKGEPGERGLDGLQGNSGTKGDQGDRGDAVCRRASQASVCDGDVCSGDQHADQDGDLHELPQV